jgi:hypothetical protein
VNGEAAFLAFRKEGRPEVMRQRKCRTYPPFCLAYSTAGAKSFSYLGSLVAARINEGLVVACHKKNKVEEQTSAGDNV